MFKKIKSNLGGIFIILIILLLFFIGYKCGNKNIIISDSIKNTSDTISIHKRDTIFLKDTIIVFKDKLVSKPYPIYIDTNKIKLQPLDSLQLYRFFIYNDSIEDSNIKIYSKIVTRGKTLNSFKPSYKLKVPIVIIDSIKTIIKDSIFITSTKLSKYQLSVGFITSPQILAPMIDLSINRSTYSIGYDPFNKQPLIKYSFRLWKSKK